jgi:ankyrin repeat protein
MVGIGGDAPSQKYDIRLSDEVKGNPIEQTLLLEKSAYIESSDKDSRTPLSWAAAYGHKAVVRLILEKNADFESKDDHGRMPPSFGYRGGAIVG